MAHNNHSGDLAEMVPIPPTQEDKPVEEVKSASVKQQEPLHQSWREEPLSDKEKTKVEEILKASLSKDVHALAQLAARRGGFVEDAVRRRAWPIVLGCEDVPPPSDEWKALPPHRDEEQVALDVNRSFVHYPLNETDASLATRRAALSDLIVSVLRTHPSLSYFQGYHDIAQVLLLVLDGLPSAAQPALARLSLLKIRDFMLPTMSGTNSHLALIPPILHAADPALCAHLGALQPFFALAATLTLFAHEIEEYGGIARLFDYLLAREAVASVYLYAAIVLLRRDELLEMGADEPDMLFHVLSKLPKPLDLDALIMRAEELMEQFPPERLARGAWKWVSGCSVLKTTRGKEGLRMQSLSQGEGWLETQAREIEKQEARKAAMEKMRRTMLAYRRPASVVVLTVLVGVFSVWLGRTGGTSTNGVVRLVHQVQQRTLGLIWRVLRMEP